MPEILGFVIEDKFVQSNILPLREKEQLALKPIYNQFAKDTVIKLPQDVHVEGGDVLLHNQVYPSGDMYTTGLCRSDYGTNQHQSTKSVAGCFS